MGGWKEESIAALRAKFQDAMQRSSARVFCLPAEEEGMKEQEKKALVSVLAAQRLGVLYTLISVWMLFRNGDHYWLLSTLWLYKATFLEKHKSDGSDG